MAQLRSAGRPMRPQEGSTVTRPRVALLSVYLFRHLATASLYTPAGARISMESAVYSGLFIVGPCSD